MSWIRHFDSAMRYAGPTAAACWCINVYPIPKHECELASKPFRPQPEDSQPESPITAYPGGYISYIGLPQIKTNKPKLWTRHSPWAQNWSQDVPPLPNAQRSARSPPEVACSWVADIWAPKGSVSQYTTTFTLLLYGCSFTDIPAQFVADGCTERL